MGRANREPVYRQYQWNVPVAAYMALRGVATAAVPMVVGTLAGLDALEDASLVAMPVVAGLLFARTMCGGVWLRDGSVVVRNPCRTRRIPLTSIVGVDPAPLFQNFFVVASVRTIDGGRVTFVPVPADEIERLAEIVSRRRAA